MKKIFCLGRPLLDITVLAGDELVSIFEKLPMNLSWEETNSILEKIKTPPLETFISSGGVEVNVAMNCATLGLKCEIAGCIGTDQLDLFHKEYSRMSQKIDPCLQVISDNQSGIIFVAIDKDNPSKRIKRIYYGASDHLKWSNAIEAGIISSDIVFSSFFSANSPNIKKVWMRTLNLASKHGKVIVIDFGGIGSIPNGKAKPLISFVNRNAQIVSMNKNEEKEILRIFHIGSVKEAMPDVALIIVTDAEDQIKIYEEKRLTSISPKRFKGRIDFPLSSGTGDAFIASFLYAQCHQVGLEDCCKFACDVAQVMLTTPGSHLNPELLERKKRRIAKWT